MGSVARGDGGYLLDSRRRSKHREVGEEHTIVSGVAMLCAMLQGWNVCMGEGGEVDKFPN